MSLPFAPAGVDCWIVRIVDDAGRRLRALGWLVAVPNEQLVVVVVAEESARPDVAAARGAFRWRIMQPPGGARGADVCERTVQCGRWLSSFHNADELRLAFDGAIQLNARRVGH